MTTSTMLQEEVLVNIWRSRWLKFGDELDCPYCVMAMDHLFNVWGFNRESAYYGQMAEGHQQLTTEGVKRPASFGRNKEFNWETYFPSNLRFVITNKSDFFKQMGVSIKIFHTRPWDSKKHPNDAEFCVFEGWVLNEWEQNETLQIPTHSLDAMNVQDIEWDNEKGLYLWRKYY